MKLRKVPYWERGENGQRVRKLSSKWYAVFKAWDEAMRRLPLFEDRRASDELARTIDRLNRVRASSDVMPPDLARAIEDMPPSVRNKLTEWGIVSAERAAAGKPLTDHVADWKAALLAKGGTPRHADQVTVRVTKVFDACGFRFWSDIQASKLQAHLAELRQDRRKPDDTVGRGISAQTFNFYLQACRQFCRWMVRDRRASENPLLHLQGLNVKTDRRHDRRALSADELRWLLDVTEYGRQAPGPNGRHVTIVEAVERFGMTAPARAMLYHLAVETGLRASELRSLTRGSFNLDGDEPSVTIAAAYAKNRRQDTLPLRPETAAKLKEHLSGKMPHTQAFAVPRRTDVSRMFRADLAGARKAWLASHQDAQARADAEQGSFLAYTDDAGRYADFHALRHSFVSNLVAGGVHAKTAQRLARHSTFNLTMDRYTHLHSASLTAALDVLPDLTLPVRQTAVATGTDGGQVSEISLLPNLPPNSEASCSPVQFGAANMPNVVNATIRPNTLEIAEKTAFLTPQVASDTIEAHSRRSGRAVECAGLENRLAGNGHGGSNPSSSVEKQQGIRGISKGGGADSGARIHDLAEVTAAWPRLPADVRAEILAKVRMVARAGQSDV